MARRIARRDASDETLKPLNEGLGMFHRRLLLLTLGFLAVLVALSSQLVRLSVVEGADRLDAAMRRLDRAEFLPTVRGSILDRQGRVLAQDRASRDLAANFEFISGVWAVRRAGEAARRRVIAEGGRAAWSALDGDARQAAILAELPAADAEADRIWREIASTARVDRAELEARLDAIRAEVHRKALAVSDRRAAIEAERLAAGDLDRPPPPQGPIREQKAFHVVVDDLDALAAIELERLAEAHPDAIEIRHTIGRERPWSAAEVAVDRRALPSPIRQEESIEIEVADPLGLLLGSLGEEVWAEDLARRPLRAADGSLDLGGYARDGERIGRSGVEAAFEDRLRGRRGLVRRNLQSGELERIEATRGEDVELSIDAALQARLAAIFDPRIGLAVPQQWHAGWSRGEPNPLALPSNWGSLGGAVVVLDVRSGEILAAVSAPGEAQTESMPPWRREVASPLVMRPFEGVYPPGSILKPIVYASAVAAGAHQADGTIECTGHFFPNLDNVARCWIYRERFGFTTHTAQVEGPLGVEEAIARSCNIYFYELARRLGPARTIEWLRRFGLDRRFGIGLGWRTDASGEARPRGEHAGFLPEPEELASIVRGGDRVTPVLLGIGQGPVAWTPLQAANAYAILARGGDVLEPTLLRQRGDRPASDRLEIPREAVLRSLEGLRRAVADPVGTGHHLTLADGSREPLLEIPGIRVWGKTGTAQAPPVRIDRDGDGVAEQAIGDLEHAWFVGLVGEEATGEPRYAIATILEHAGSGGRAAGPLAAAVVRALVAEGYLEAASEATR
jgi:penicillin-binding protein 2